MFIDLNEIALESDEEVEVALPPTIQARTHLVKVREAEGKRLRFMPLYTLSDRLLERTLAPENDRINKVLIEGLTCRPVQWHSRDGDVFNGKTGVGLSLADCKTEELELPDFSILKDERHIGDDTDEPPTKTWEHVGDPPTLSQWLSGTGLTRQVEPGARSDIPKDARKFLAAGPADVGRLRVPKGQDSLLSPAVEPAQAPAAPTSSFFSLLTGEGSETDEDEADQTGSDEDAEGPGESETGGNTLDILRAGSKKSMVQGDWPLLDPKARASKPAPSSAAAGLQVQSRSSKPALASRVLDDRTNNPPPTSNTSNMPRNNAGQANVANDSVRGDFPEYGPHFVKVDDVGLTGNAANTAEWERQHYDPQVSRKSKKKSKPVVPRSITSVAQGEPQSSTSYTPSHACSFQIQGISRQDSQAAHWTNKVVIANTKGPKLIDDAAVISSRPVQIPPGLQEPVQSGDAPSHADDESDGEIRETVKRLPAEFASKRNTMRQKAGKKGKGKKPTPKPAAVKVQLPLPSPPPPPRPKPKGLAPVPAPPLHHEPTFHGTAGVPGPSCEEQPILETTADLASIVHPQHAFAQYLLELKHKICEEQEDEENESECDECDDMSNRVKLVATIGVLLTRPTSKDFNRGILAPAASQKQLNACWDSLRTDLFHRLTTSKEDAKLILDLVGEDAEPQPVYEIWVRDAGGTQLIISVPSHDKMTYTVKLLDRSLAEAYLHYPMHVWDARFALVKPGADYKSSSDDAIKELVSSMQTEDDGPSFKAMERVGLLTVQRVLAKRIFTKKGRGGTLQVTQVQDMGIESVDDKRYNFVAITLSHLEMVDMHRLWWEATWETTDLDNAAILEQKVDETVRAIDVVGVENMGPYHYGAEESDEDEAPVIPFW